MNDVCNYTCRMCGHEFEVEVEINSPDELQVLNPTCCQKCCVPVNSSSCLNDYNDRNEDEKRQQNEQ